MIWLHWLSSDSWNWERSHWIKYEMTKRIITVSFYTEWKEQQLVNERGNVNKNENNNQNGYCFIKNNHVKIVIHFASLNGSMDAWIVAALCVCVCISAKGQMVNITFEALFINAHFKVLLLLFLFLLDIWWLHLASS